MNDKAYRGFTTGKWVNEVNVRDFIQLNYTPYEGDASFLVGPTQKTLDLFEKVQVLQKEEIDKGGMLDVDVMTPSSLTSHKAGYIEKDLEEIVGLQTDAPLRRSVMPKGGVRTVENACQAYGYTLDPSLSEIFRKYRKTHNDGVFTVYDEEIRKCRKSGVITGLPDGYGRGRIIGDYRRVALYGVDFLIQEKKQERSSIDKLEFDEQTIRLNEELSEQINALEDLKIMASFYGFDISRPAENGKEAIQWLYFAYIGAAKEQDGAATSIGRTSTFLDIYLQRDIEEGSITEEQAQEYMDHFVMKLRLIRFLRTPDYNELFSGDPVWVTESIGGMSEDGRTLVTKNSFRVLQTLYNLGPAPEPNLTVLWSEKLPQGFKEYCSRVSIDTSSIQYENDDLMIGHWGDDYGIACCVSAMRIGKQMQYFGARCNMAKALLYAMNGGRDEMSGEQVGPVYEPVKGDILDYEDVMKRFDVFLDWIATVYVRALNKIHYMHDKYAYERLQMSLHDKDILRTMACGIAGLSICADSLSAMRYAKVKPIRQEDGLIIDYEVEGDFPTFGNADERVDSIATDLVERFMSKIKKHKTYRNSVPTQSVLTITSNVVYGKKTGNTPDGRRKGEPFAPGANPMHGRDQNGAVAAAISLSKLPYEESLDGISWTFSIVPKALGKNDQEQDKNLVGFLDGYFGMKGHHINVNVFNRDMLLDAMEHPELYPQLTVRVSGYAVNFVKLTKDQQRDVVNRTFHTRVS